MVTAAEFAKFNNILSNSSLQRSNPHLNDGNKSNVANSHQLLSGYVDEYFYVDKSSENLTFTISGHKNRSEIRVNQNFDTAEPNIERTLSASLQPINIQATLEKAVSGDEVTFLQIHNKGTDSSGHGYIPHPLLRITYEAERNGKYGHYWATIKLNALDCRTSVESLASECSNAYKKFDLGEAKLKQMTDFDITVHESQLTIKVNNVEKVNHNIQYWSHLLSYFKAGVYNQYDDGDGINSWSQVQFAKLNVVEKNFYVQKPLEWDINKWKLSIPVTKKDWNTKNNSTTVADFSPEHCFNSPQSESFVLTNQTNLAYRYPTGLISFFKVEDQRLHFSADMGYGVTTANSNYIRSELRELFNTDSVSTCSTNTSNTSWKVNDSATQTHRHTLTSTLRIDEYPSVLGQLPKVVVGQVHGWEIKQALIKILWEGDDKPVRVQLNQSFFTNNKACKNNESNCNAWPFSIEMGTYASKIDWQYQIVVDDNGLQITTQQTDGSQRVQRNLYWGQPFSKTKEGKKVTMDSKWANDDIAYYFKAGIYPQFKPTPSYANQRFSVSFSQIEVSHE
uniref:Polysaccharide lyase family 7 protein n=2 Tax=Vibrio ziniensis TaxID=2711221 RepID=A0A6G7CMC7_9VIBR|nr:polysaccharide lyase family 7 protein [Vibrio ziniensis]QOT69927.1 alginate lyase [Vibrio ziniensis]